MTDSVLSSTISTQVNDGNSTHSVSEDIKDNSSQLREDLEWNFNLIKKCYPDVVIPKFTDNSDIEIMKKTYEDIKNRIKNAKTLSCEQLLSLRTLFLDFELQNPADAFIYLAGSYDENKQPYECIKYKISFIPRYKKKKGLFSCLLSRSSDLIYGLYIPLRVTMLKISQNHINCEDKYSEVIYQGESLQDENGYIFFDKPLCMYLTPFHNIFIEYSIDETRYKYTDNTLNKFFHPVFIAGTFQNETRVKGLSDIKIPILKNKGIFIEKNNGGSYKLVKENIASIE